MKPAPAYPIEGGCACRAVRYRVLGAPLFVHCCHCRWCQRESGSAFALNALLETERVESLGLEPELVATPTESGAGQQIARCPHCRVAVWSHYAGSGPLVKFLRVGTLDDPDLLPPDIHIFTSSKQPWVQLPPGTPAVPEYYDRSKYWPPDSLARADLLAPRIKAYQKAGCDVDPKNPAHVQAYLQMRMFQSRITPAGFWNFLKKKETKGGAGAKTRVEY